MFPDNFVKVLPVNPPPDKGEEKVTLRNKKRCKVLFSYQPVHEDELELKALVEERNKKNSVGANNVVKESLESDKSTKDLADNSVQRGSTQSKSEPEPGRKMSASQRSQIGPESPPPDAAPRLPPKPVKEQCMVLFPYTAQNEDELSLQEGQLITIITKDCEDKGR